MSKPFRLNKTVDRASNVDLDDVWSLKHALQGLGYYRPPDFGMHKYPDAELFDGIKRFQKEQGLTIDGVMNPDGETATKLGEIISLQHTTRNTLWPGRSPLGIAHSAIPVAAPISTSPRPFRLKSWIDRAANVDLDDALRTKKALHRLGYYRIPSYGMNPYPDEPLFDGITRFQKDHDLVVDGVMKPDGETATKLGEIIGSRGITSTLSWPIRRTSGARVDGMRSLLRPLRVTQETDEGDGENPGENEPEEDNPSDDEQEAMLAPPIIVAIAEFFGMTVAAAWAWWNSMSAAERERIRQQVEGDDEEQSGDDQCMEQYNDDADTCRSLRNSSYRGRCWASAAERLANCKSSRPLPPLDTGE